MSRYADVERGLADRTTFISGRGGILEIIKAGIEMPPGVVIFEDPPTHTIHRSLMSRVFTPRKVAALEPQIRAFSAACLDPLVGAERFDLIADFAAHMPMRVIGMLLGIPEADQETIRDRGDATLRTEAGKAMRISQDNFVTGEMFGEYIDWRAEHPSDDIMTDLLTAEFEDETGTRRRLTRQEVLTYVQVVAGAGNETTTRLIGWTAKTLAEHPDQRRELAADHSLIPAAIEEILRYEPPAPHVGRYVAVDTEFHGQPVPAGSAILFLVGAANRDDRRFPDGDRFDIHRDAPSHLAFGYGAALLPGRSPGTAGGPHRARRDADPLPRLGGRPGRGRARPDLDGTGLGDPPPGHAIFADQPPSTGMIAPETNDALSDARNAATSATSSG